MQKQYSLDDPERPFDIVQVLHRLARLSVQDPTPDLQLLLQAIKAQAFDDLHNLGYRWEITSPALPAKAREAVRRARRPVTEQRDQFLYRLYKEHPNVSQERLVMLANEEPCIPGGRPFQDYDVKNAWNRHREWPPWERANRIR
jgi:hypothetical protein